MATILVALHAARPHSERHFAAALLAFRLAIDSRGLALGDRIH
jgi:hypothetical protein